MITVYERGILSRYGQSKSTQARHQAKLYCMLDWLLRWGYTSSSVLVALWGLERSVVNRMLRRYVNEGAVAEVPVYSCRDKRVFILKPAGLRLLEDFHQQRFKYGVKSSSFPKKELNHDLMVQYLVARGVKSGEYQFYINESEQSKDGTGRRRRLDAIVYNGEELIGLEIECSSKTIPYRLDIIRRYKTAIVEENKVNKILRLAINVNTSKMLSAFTTSFLMNLKTILNAHFLKSTSSMFIASSLQRSYTSHFGLIKFIEWEKTGSTISRTPVFILYQGEAFKAYRHRKLKRCRGLHTQL